MEIRKTILHSQFICLLITLGTVLRGPIHFSKEYLGRTLRINDGQTFTILRHASLYAHKSSSGEALAVFIARLKFARLSQKANRLASLIPIPFIVGFPGFRKRSWIVNSDTRYWQGMLSMGIGTDSGEIYEKKLDQLMGTIYAL